jgi:septum site-determining protein MinC
VPWGRAEIPRQRNRTIPLSPIKMPVSPIQREYREPAFELKGRNFTLPVLRLLRSDMDAITAELTEKVEQAPELFRNAPLLIDLELLREPGGGVDFPVLIGLLRGCGLIPVAVKGGTAEQNEAALALDLGILPVLKAQRERRNPGLAPAKAAPGKSPSTIVRQLVRSGQQVYARGADLIVLGAVSAGAEILADGHIHVYGALRGRALAGVHGDQEARVFCQALYAELVSIAGHYRISEDFPEGLWGNPVQIFFENNQLSINPL